MFRKHFNATTIVAIVALVFAMTGGAYAAKHYLITNTKQISPKVLKQLKGQNGKNGANGAAGAAGANGKDGAQGLPGKDGNNGTNGTNGKDGASVSSATVLTASSTCSKLGGSEFTAAEGKKTTACNGKEGSPWTDKGVLPQGSSETGTWSAISVENAFKTIGGVASVSFAIPLAAAPTVEYIGEGEEGLVHATECPGTLSEPKAAEGYLCVYTENQGAGGAFESPHSFAAGAVLQVKEAAVGFEMYGTWAVTA